MERALLVSNFRECECAGRDLSERKMGDGKVNIG